MKRLVLASAIAMTGLAACDDFTRPAAPEEPAVAEAPVAPAAEDVAVPTTTPAPVDTPPPTDSTTMPPPPATSEQSVQPESETLFY